MIPQVWEASTSKHEGLINEHRAFRAPKRGGVPLITQKAYDAHPVLMGFPMFSM